MATIGQRMFSWFQGGDVRVPQRVTPYKEQGSAGYSVYGGYITTTERNSDWIGKNKYVTSSDIATNISIVAASVYYFLNLIAHPKWSAVPPKDFEKNKKAIDFAKFATDIINEMDTPWARVVRRSGMYRFHGFGIQEWTAKKRADGKIGLLDIEPRPQWTIERWDVSDSGSINGVWQRSPQTQALLPLPRTKFLYLVEDTLTDSPEGLGLFRHLGEPYERLQQLFKLEIRGFERDLRGVPVGKAPLSALERMVKEGTIDGDLAKKMVGALERFVQTQVKAQNTGIVMDSATYESQSADGLKVSSSPQWGAELLSGGATGLGDIAKAIDRVQREMARLLGTESLMLGDQGGNRALSTDKSRNLYLVANSVLNNIVEASNKDIIPRIWALNGFPEEMMPKYQAEDVAFKDVEQVTTALAKMAQAGASLAPDDPAINDVRTLLGIEKAPEPSPEMLGAHYTPQTQQREQSEHSQELRERDREHASEIAPEDDDDEDITKRFDPNQLRYPKGDVRGGQWAGTGEATDLYNRKKGEDVTLEEFYRSLTPEQRAAILKAESDLSEGVPTDALTAEGGFRNADGTWTPGRQAVHMRIMNQLFTPDAVRQATPLAGQDPTVIFLGGRPGAGKTSNIGALPFNPQNFISVNADDIQTMLPGYRPHLAGLFHEEASVIASQAEQIARAARLSVLYDATLRTPGGAQQRIADYSRAGYKLEGYLFSVSPVTAARRVVDRFMKTGRYVPPSYVLNSRSSELTFDTIKPAFDKWQIYDTNPPGGPAVLVAEGGR